MKSAPTAREPRLEVSATQPFGASIARDPIASARPSEGYDVWHGIRGLEGGANGRAAGAASGSPTAAEGLAGVVAGMVARVAAALARELRVRRDTRHLMAMSDHMLRDIGVTRADISSAVRYGRD